MGRPEVVSFEGRVAIVTGGGRELGLGRAYALELARRGGRVVVNDVLGIDAPAGPAADRVVDEIRALGGRAIPSYASVATEGGAAQIVADALDAFGTVDVVIHNAGTWRNAPFSGMTEELIDPVLDVHLKGGFFLARAAWDLMVAKGYGRIVLTSSPAGFFGRTEGANYAAAKTGLYGLCRALSLEGGPHGVCTNCVVPIANTMSDEERQAAGRILAPRLAAASAALRGRDEPERVAALVAYLASDRCTATGEAFTAIAGHYGRILVAVTDGWLSPTGQVSTAEDIARNWPAIHAPGGYHVPGSVIEAMESVADAVRRADTP